MSRLQRLHDATTRNAATLPQLLIACSFVACIGTPTNHSLLICAIAWSIVYTACAAHSGSTLLPTASQAQAPAWAAGILLVVAQLGQRAGDQGDIWWAKALVPIVIYTCVTVSITQDIGLAVTPAQPSAVPSSPQSLRSTTKSSIFGSSTVLVVWGLSALIALSAGYAWIANAALGLSCTVVESLALCLIERARKDAGHRVHVPGRRRVSANGLPILAPSLRPGEDPWVQILQDVSLAAAISTWAAAISLERLTFDGLSSWGLLDRLLGDSWVRGHIVLSAVLGAVVVLVHCIMYTTLILMIRKQGAFSTSSTLTVAAVGAQNVIRPAISRLWFSALCASASALLIGERHATADEISKKARVRATLRVVAVVSFVIFALSHARYSLFNARLSFSPQRSSRLAISSPVQSSAPLQFASTQVHPVEQLIQDAQTSWDAKIRSQSGSLNEAVAEYKRRYGLPPPPHFDKWYEFATARGVQLIDEYDTIYDSLLPFWALKPATIRARAKEALGFSNIALMGLLIRGGKAVHVENGPDWFQQAAVGMMDHFARYLPDMDLAFNLSDEPRVVVPHDELSRMVQSALVGDVAIAARNPALTNSFSARPNDVDNGKRIAEVKTTRFNQFAHQPTWIPSRMSCPIDSPARSIDESLATDNLTSFALSDIGFIYNLTAFSDICNSPSFATSHGFFDRPNSYSVVHELFPIFSQSKMSSYQDITYPSPWYWFGKVPYNSLTDVDWQKKESKLWWRGSTTGGFSRAGGWKRQHRQLYVRKLNGLDKAKVMEKQQVQGKAGTETAQWTLKERPRQELSSLMDVHFSSVGQCDPGDCDAQREFFHIVDPATQSDAWKYKYLLDVDGNAFSGRFYAFLQSQSLTFKMAVFREWHAEWIQPWVHYIPLSLRADEVLETVRYLDQETEGRPKAMQIAAASSEWAQKALRNEDLEAWFFRLLLEYARVIDDDRANIGFVSM